MVNNRCTSDIPITTEEETLEQTMNRWMTATTKGIYIAIMT